MPRLINLADHKNLWGATTVAGLEPQRSDLWLVDLTQLVKGLKDQKLFERLGLADVPTFFPQFVQSITLPELKMKPEVYRRDSIPFNMPSWDEPLDAVKITFILDTYTNPNQSYVTSILQAWQAIVRAGRGDRSMLYTDSNLVIPLNANFRYDYTFSIRIAQLRGGEAMTGGLTGEQIQQMNQQMVNNYVYTAAQEDALQATIDGAPTSDVETAVTYAQMANPGAAIIPIRSTSEPARPLDRQPWLHVAGNWLLKDAWLAGWKMSDLNYNDSKLVTVDATIYAEDLYETAT